MFRSNLSPWARPARLQIPPTAIWGNLNIYWQAGYLDAGAPFGFSATQGMQMFIR